MLRQLHLLILLQVVHAQCDTWSQAANRRDQIYGSNNEHHTLGRMSFSDRRSRELNFSLLPNSNLDMHLESTDLDTSQWSASIDCIDEIAGVTSDGGSSDSIKPAPFSRFTGRRILHGRFSDAILVSIRTRLETQPAVEASSIETEDAQSQQLLEEVTQPIVKTDIWDRLTGREFEVPSTVAALAKMGLKMTRRSYSEWVEWKPADKTTSKVEDGDLDETDVLKSGDVLVYKGMFRKEGYGGKLPVIKTRSIVPLSPRELADLLMDSSRVRTYNSMSLGRDDVHVMQNGLDTLEGFFGDGESKIVRNLTKPPITKNKMEFVTMMHARPLRPDDGVERGGYIVISRAVAGDKWGGDNNDDSLTRNEILLGVNLIQESLSGNSYESEVTSVTHVYSPSIPIMLAGKVGVKGAVDFVKDIRKLRQPKDA